MTGNPPLMEIPLMKITLMECKGVMVTLLWTIPNQGAATPMIHQIVPIMVLRTIQTTAVPITTILMIQGLKVAQ